MGAVLLGCGGRSTLEAGVMGSPAAGGASGVMATAAGRGGNASSAELPDAGAPPPTPAAAHWSDKTRLLAADCQSSRVDPVCSVSDLTLSMSARGDVTVVFGSRIRARFAGGSWTALIAESIAYTEVNLWTPYPAIRPWLSADGQRFMASWRYGAGFYAPSSVRTLTLEASDWQKPLAAWPQPRDVGGSGFTARDAVPAPPAPGPTRYFSDMVLSRDGSRAVLLSSGSSNLDRSATSVLWWNGSTWTELTPPFAIGAAQWPGYLESCGQNFCSDTWSQSEVSVNGTSIALLGASPPQTEASLQFASTTSSDDSWQVEPALDLGTTAAPNTWGFELAGESSAAVADWETGCGVWTGAKWVLQAVERSFQSTPQNQQRSLGLSDDGRLAVCSGRRVGSSPFETRATAAVWDGTAWHLADIGDGNCSPADVAVSDAGTLAAVGLMCSNGPEVALYRGGAWTVDTLSDDVRNDSSPRVAVSADGTSAVAVWLESGGLFAAYYR